MKETSKNKQEAKQTNKQRRKKSGVGTESRVNG